MELVIKGESDMYILFLFSVIVPLKYNVGLILYLCSVWSCYETAVFGLVTKQAPFL
jgi:hypothetical protein